ncbi:MAG: PfkB family carbohydrate kinase [Polyangiales bacterium]
MSRIVVLGETLIDLGPEGHGPRIGGACANVAVTLARLGREVALIGAVGDDAEGAWLVGEIEKAGVEVSCIARVKGKKTGRVHLSGDGNSWRFRPERSDGAEWEVTESQLSCLDEKGSWLHLGVSSIAGRLFPIAMRAATNARVISADLNARMVGFESRDALISSCRALALMARVLKVSESDLRTLGYETDRDGARALHAARIATSSLLQVTIATFGARGAVALANEHELETPVVEVLDVEPSGAGDAFMAGIIATMADDGDDDARLATRTTTTKVERALAIASILGAHATTQIGATTALTNPRALLGDHARHIPLDSPRFRSHSST